MGNIKIIKEELLSDNWYSLKKYTYEIWKKDGSLQKQTREVYDRGNGAAILLYNALSLRKILQLNSFKN
jgi:GDP-mannose pyrophosphatase NudK